MSNDLNLCQFIGRLGADPEIRYSANGNAVTKIRLACGRTWKDKDGTKQEATEWVRATAFGKLAEILGQYPKKGDLLYIAGRMQTSEYEKNGERRFSTEIVMEQMQMLGSRSGGGGSNDFGRGQERQAQPADPFDDTEIPF